VEGLPAGKEYRVRTVLLLLCGGLGLALPDLGAGRVLAREFAPGLSLSRRMDSSDPSIIDRLYHQPF